jgi:hypothetical protein
MPLLTSAASTYAFQVNSPTRDWIGFQLIVSVGMGILYAAPQFPILASLPTSKTAHALSFFTFVRPLDLSSDRVTIGLTALLVLTGRSAPLARSGV